MRKYLKIVFLVLNVISGVAYGQTSKISQEPRTNIVTTNADIIVNVNVGGTNYSTRIMSIPAFFTASGVTNQIALSFIGIGAPAGGALAGTLPNPQIANGANGTNLALWGGLQYAALTAGQEFTFYTSNQEATIGLRSTLTNGLSAIFVDSPGTGIGSTGPLQFTIGMAGSPQASLAGGGQIYAGPGNDAVAAFYHDASGSRNNVTNILTPGVLLGQAGLWQGHAWADYGRIWVGTNGQIEFHGIDGSTHWGGVLTLFMDPTNGIEGITSRSYDSKSGPGTVAVTSSGWLQGSGTSFNADLQTNKTISVNGTVYPVLRVTNNLNALVAPFGVQAGGSSYTLQPSSLILYPSTGSAVNAGLHVDGNGNMTLYGSGLGNSSYIQLFDFGVNPAMWRLQSAFGDFAIQNVGSNTSPVFIDHRVANNAVVLDQNSVFKPLAIATSTANGSALVNISPTGSPFSWTNTIGTNVFVFQAGGTVSAVSINGTALGGSVGMIPLQPNEVVTVTYTGAPTMKYKPW